ncbi:MAG: hypothetical protein V1851_03415 [Patescibacteria group bacterium]
MKNEKTYDGQTASFLAAVATCMPRNLNGEIMQGWIDNPKALQKFLLGLCPKEIGDVFDPHEFFKTRPGLWVSSDFCDRILSVAKKTMKSPLIKEGHFDLQEPMTDSEIRKELGDGHVFEDASEFSLFLAGLIDQQPKGEEVGDLITNGYGNIFYVRGADKVFAVLVYWSADGRRWVVGAARLGGNQWDARGRAFSRN